MTAIDFHDPKNRNSYTSRDVHTEWGKALTAFVDFHGKRAVDIGCGGGIYSRELLRLGVLHVTGVDFSEEMLRGARKAGNVNEDSFTLHQGEAAFTGLPDQSFDIVLERALIHHISDLSACFSETFRLLSDGGMLIVQDRTPEDCLLPGSREHLRGYFFKKFPKLITLETSRRHSEETVRQALSAAGYVTVRTLKLWETRRVYTGIGELRDDLLKRTGRSILHALNDAELVELADFISDQLSESDEAEIYERDCWTVWLATKPGTAASI